MDANGEVHVFFFSEKNELLEMTLENNLWIFKQIPINGDVKRLFPNRNRTVSQQCTMDLDYKSLEVCYRHPDIVIFCHLHIFIPGESRVSAVLQLTKGKNANSRLFVIFVVENEWIQTEFVWNRHQPESFSAPSKLAKLKSKVLFELYNRGKINYIFCV